MTDDLDLFGGPGGWDLGARGLQLDPLGIDNNAEAVATAQAAGFRRVRADVAALDPVDLAPHGCRLLIASPPCGPFSTAGKGRGREGKAAILEGVADIASGADPRTVCKGLDEALGAPDAALVLEPLRWALDLEPETIALEQVPPVLPLWQAIADVLRADGYSVWTGNVTAEQYDVAQTRRRALLLASRSRTIVGPPPAARRSLRRGVGQHECRDLLDEALQPWLSMAQALGWEGPEWLAEAVDGKPRVNDQSGTPVDLDWPYKRPATAIAGRGLVQHPGATANRFNGATKSRNDGIRVTVAEAAALQSFPADYPWQGSQAARYRQVGDAVPPALAAHALAHALGLAPPRFVA